MGEELSGEPPVIGLPDLTDLCRRLNEAGVQYLIYGGMACLLHGYERMTKDIDLCVGEDRGNIEKALKVLANWGEGLAAELTVQEVLDNVVVRIFDRFVLDVSSRIWKVEWKDAYARRRLVEVNGVVIPVLSRRDLIASKTTYRDRDAVDLQVLRTLSSPEPGRAADEAPAGA